MTHYTEEEYQQYIINQRGRAPGPGYFSKEDIPDPGLEKRLLSKCLNYCKERGYPTWHDWSRGKNEPGWPDIIIFVPGGMPILIETKSAKGVFRKEQEALARRFMYLKYRYFKIKSFTKFLSIMNQEAKCPSSDTQYP